MGIGIGTFFVHGSALATDGWLTQPTLHGEKVVFVSEGDLWVATIPPDSVDEILAHRLTSASGEESRPVFSPDGKMVAFSGVYDGNRDVYVMSVRGGAPKRLTFHPARDVPMSFSPDGRSITFWSGRASPVGRAEGYRVDVTGGLPEPLDFGECTQLDYSATGRQIAFTPYSNETWNWRNYRGGTAPDVWIGIPEAGDFKKLTDEDANDLFPMWTGSRITFLSDRTGHPNLYSARPDGSDVKAHTSFAADLNNSTAIEGYELRWPSRDRSRGGTQVVFTQGGQLGVLDLSNDSVRRLPIKLVSDRARTRVHTEDALAAMDAFALSPGGKRFLLEARGELVLVPIMGVAEESVKVGSPRQITHSAGIRERNAAWIDEDTIALITDSAGEQQLGRLIIDEPGAPLLLTEDREDWIIDIQTSPGGQWAAFSDRTGRLHLLNFDSLNIRELARTKAGEIVDFSFSPDDEWLAFSMPNANSMQSISLHSMRTDRTIPLSDGLTSDHSPRFSPDGTTLYFLSERNLDPTLGTRDFEHVFLNTTEVFAAPLEKSGVPPLPEAKELVVQAPVDEVTEDPVPPEQDRIKIDPEGLLTRAVKLPIPPGNYELKDSIVGGLLLVEWPTRSLLEEVWPEPPLGADDGVLLRYDIESATLDTLASDVSEISVAKFGPIALLYGSEGFMLVHTDDPGIPPLPLELDEAPMLVDVQAEWAQIFDEAWRLQRDFFWAPNMRGVDWDAMRTKYAARLPQIGTRNELNELIGEMLAELGTSHTYIWGGDDRNQAEPIDVGLLGADLTLDKGSVRIRNRLAAPNWSGLADGPVAPDWVGVPENSVLRSIDGRSLVSTENPYELLQGKAGAVVTLGISNEPGGEIRTVRVRPISEERPLRYANWVESNRIMVEKATDGRVGYLHLPDMDGDGLSMFGRLFYPQVKKNGMIVDVRDNDGGFVSQLVISRLARRPWAYGQPRQGAVETYPAVVVDGPMAVLINEHAGSDGDIFPESFKILELGPLIGTRTWGGVIGIRADKPSVDGGITTQPEYAWWEPKRGWSLENSGVEPDIEVEITPADRQAGRDRQLERAIKELTDALEKNPPQKPTPPPYPQN